MNYIVTICVRVCSTYL